MKSATLIGTLILAGAGIPALAADEPQTHMHGTDPAGAKTVAGHGKVNAIDLAAGKVNITHDPIKSLKWPKMTMDFQASSPTLKDIKPGMEVDFELRKTGDAYHIVKIVPAKP